MTNYIPALNVKIGDVVQYRTGDLHIPKEQYFKVTSIKDMGNNVIRFGLGKRDARNYRNMDVRKNQEVRIMV